MLLKDEVGMLKRVPLFSGVEPAKLKLLAFTSDRVTYNPGQVLFNQGDEGDAAYVILTGTADILVEADGGRLRSAVRFASLGGRLHVHSAFPTVEPDAVSSGPTPTASPAPSREASRPMLCGASSIPAKLPPNPSSR